MGKDGQRLNDLIGAISGIETLLRVEGVTLSAAPPSTPPVPAAATAPSSPAGLTLYHVLREALADGRPRDEKELIEIAKKRGVDFGEKEPRRTVAFTLMGIARGRTIRRVKDNIWQGVAQ